MRKRLGEILVAERVIDAAQLQAALAEAALLGRRVGEVLLNRGDCTEEQILEALAAQLGVPVAPLATTAMLPERLLKLIPGSIARDRLVLPVFLDAHSGVLEVAMADPADQELIDELRFSTGHDVRPLVAMASEVAEAVERFYEAPRRGAPSTPPPAAPMVTARHTSATKVTRPVTPSPPPGETEELEDLPAIEGGADVEVLRAQVAHLRSQLARAYGILREASAAHQTLLGLLEERGVVDRAEFDTKLAERLSRLTPR